MSEKVSRKAILDKSLQSARVVDEEDIWFSTSKLFQVRNLKSVGNIVIKLLTFRTI